MTYSDDYLYSKDIDWFCIINGIFVHIASAGGILLEEVNDREKLRKNQYLVNQMDDIFNDDQIVLNWGFLHERFGNNVDSEENIMNYLESFISMSRKGFVSLDRTNLEDPNDNTYHIVCMPNKIIALPNAFNLCTYKSNNPNLLNYVGQNISLLEEITLL